MSMGDRVNNDPAKIVAEKKPAAKVATKPRSRPRAKPGRPSKYSEELVKAICGWLKQSYTLRQISVLPNMPDKSTIIRWLGEHDEFRDQYAYAREVQAFVMEDEIQEIADDSRNDWMERERKDGTMELVPNEEIITRSRLRIDSRKWLMAKMAPKRYGDRVAVTGKDGGPLKHMHTTVESVFDEIDGDGTGLPKRSRNEADR